MMEIISHDFFTKIKLNHTTTIKLYDLYFTQFESQCMCFLHVTRRNQLHYSDIGKRIVARSHSENVCYLLFNLFRC